MPPAPLVLASGSPRRRELLARLGCAFRVIVPQVDETGLDGEEPDAYVARIARAKALAVAAPDRVVLAADTAVVLDGAVLGKPDGADGATAMLAALSGKAHRVLTGVAVAAADGVAVRVEEARVVMREISASEIAWYVATGEPLDKAGGYAAQGAGAVFVERVEGDITTVIGLPLGAAAALVGAAGIEPLGAAAPVVGDTMTVRDHGRPCEHGSLWPHWESVREAKWWQEPECLGGAPITLRRSADGTWVADRV